MTGFDDLPPLLTVEETSRVVRLGINQTYAACRSGEIPALRFGRTWRVPKASLLALIGADPSPNGDAPAATYGEGVEIRDRGDDQERAHGKPHLR